MLGSTYLFQGRLNFSNGHCDLIPLQIFHFDICEHLGPTYAPKNILSHSGEKVSLIGFGIFSIDGSKGLLTN